MNITRTAFAIEQGFEPHATASIDAARIEMNGYEGKFPVYVELVVNSKRTTMMVQHEGSIIHTADYCDD